MSMQTTFEDVFGHRGRYLEGGLAAIEKPTTETLALDNLNDFFNTMANTPGYEIIHRAVPAKIAAEVCNSFGGERELISMQDNNCQYLAPQSAIKLLGHFQQVNICLIYRNIFADFEKSNIEKL